MLNIATSLKGVVRGLTLFFFFPPSPVLGQKNLNTVFNSLVQMQNRMAILLCNLKPAKMRGVTSQAMVMCASSPDLVEILDPPNGAVPGERVTFQGFSGLFFFSLLVSKKKSIKKWNSPPVNPHSLIGWYCGCLKQHSELVVQILCFLENNIELWPLEENTFWGVFI